MLRNLVTKGAWPVEWVRLSIGSVAAASTHGAVAHFSTDIGPDKEKIFVTNIAFEVMKRENWDKLKNFFSNYGVSHIFYVKDKASRRFKGNAIVALDKDKIDQAIAELNGKEFMGRELRVRKSIPPQSSNPGESAATAHSATQSAGQALQTPAAPSATQSAGQAPQTPAAPSATQSAAQAPQTPTAPSATQSAGQAPQTPAAPSATQSAGQAPQTPAAPSATQSGGQASDLNSGPQSSGLTDDKQTARSS